MTQFLVVLARSFACAIPLTEVVEIMRPLPVQPMTRMLPFVQGLSLVRGRPVPVLDLGSLLAGAGEGRVTRYVTIRSERRLVALAVEEVVGVRRIGPTELEALPPLFREGGSDLVDTIGALDARLLVVLRSSHVLSAEASQALPADQERP